MDNFEEFEREMSGIEDPNPFSVRKNVPSHAREVCEALNDITNWVSLDLAQALNEGKPGVIQYLNRTNGACVTVAAMSDRKLAFVITLAADDDPFIAIIAEPVEDPGPEEPVTYDPDKDNG